jgi:hypothetical protein
LSKIQDLLFWVEDEADSWLLNQSVS